MFDMNSFVINQTNLRVVHVNNKDYGFVIFANGDASTVNIENSDLSLFFIAKAIHGGSGAITGWKDSFVRNG